jgi:hypothetical protein
MIQEIVVFVLFIGAIGYVGSIFWKSLSNDSNCKSGCGCDTKDINKLQKQIIRRSSGTSRIK